MFIYIKFSKVYKILTSTYLLLLTFYYLPFYSYFINCFSTVYLILREYRNAGYTGLRNMDNRIIGRQEYAGLRNMYNRNIGTQENLERNMDNRNIET